MSFVTSSFHLISWISLCDLTDFKPCPISLRHAQGRDQIDLRSINLYLFTFNRFLQNINHNTPLHPPQERSFSYFRLFVYLSVFLGALNHTVWPSAFISGMTILISWPPIWHVSCLIISTVGAHQVQCYLFFLFISSKTCHL